MVNHSIMIPGVPRSSCTDKQHWRLDILTWSNNLTASVYTQQIHCPTLLIVCIIVSIFEDVSLEIRLLISFICYI